MTAWGVFRAAHLHDYNRAATRYWFALAACGVIMFIVSWHELLIPLILNARPDFMTLPVVIASLVGDVFVFFNLMMAICLLALAPTVILVALLQKYIVEGLAAGAVKG